MILGAGVDLVEVKRIEKALRRWDEKFLKRVFTADEISAVQGKRFPIQHLAARFAAKEAVFKALSAVWPSGRITWKDVEIRNEPDGSPKVSLQGGYQDELRKRSQKLLVSISHTRTNALASVFLVGPGERWASRDIVERP